MIPGIEYRVVDDGFVLLLNGEHYKQLGLKIKKGENVKLFLKLLKSFVSDLNELYKD